MAFNAQGTLLFWSTSTAASTASGSVVAEVISFNGPTGAANIIDCSHLGSTAKEFLMGLRDEGEVSLTCNFKPSDSSGQNAMRVNRANREMRKAVIKLNDSTLDASTTKMTFDAYCTGFSVQGAVDQAVQVNINLKITGAVTFSSVIT